MDGSSYETELPALFLAPGREEGPKWHLERAESECLKAMADPDLSPASSDPGHGIDLSEPLPPHLSVGITVVPAHRCCDIHRRWCM